MKLYVVRHGQINDNAHRMFSLTDHPLNEIGIMQAKETAKIVKDLDYDFVICSPLTRTKQTCSIINEIQNKEVIYDERIVERDSGSLEGKTIFEFDYANYWNYYKNDLYDKTLSIQDFYQRIWIFLKELEDKYTDKTILIVTHNGVCRAIATYYEGIPEDGNTEIYCFENAQLREFYSSSILLQNIDHIHTTDLGIERIKKNLCLDTDDVVEWCKEKIMDKKSFICRKGKNWYIDIEDCQITVNAIVIPLLLLIGSNNNLSLKNYRKYTISKKSYKNL